jgi:hypothetical protein
MQVLLAVIDDLWKFARTALFGSFSLQVDSNDMVLQREAQATPQLSLLPTHTNEISVHAGGDIQFTQGEQYFVGAANTYLYVDPVVAFDTASLPLPYGTLVSVEKLGGRWAYITTGLYEGWVFKDVLLEQAKDVFPSFVDGVLYDKEHSETQKLRLCIGDAFLGGETQSLLSDVEYVTYKLGRKNIAISWGFERPRIAGSWQKKLRGRENIHIGINPKTDTVMEYVQDDIGHLAYVEAVFPDATIRLSSVGLFEEGVFNESVLQKEEWRELRPVFIEIT